MSAKNVQFSVSVHLMAALAYRHPAPMTSKILSGSVNADPGFVRRALSKLVKAGLINTTKGPLGSCSLAKPPKNISLWEIYQAAELPTAFSIHAYPIQKACPVSAHFKPCLENILDVVECQIEKALAKITLSEIISDLNDRL